jgi:RimJ/RimL family protein N-acetyltransferase
MERPEHLVVTPEYAIYRPAGSGDFAFWLERLASVLAWGASTGVERMLVDFTRITGLSVPTTFERFQLGERSATAAASSGMIIAMVAPERLLDPDRFAMTVAQNRGLRVKVFTDEVSALQWLIGPNAIRPVLETARTRLRWLTPTDAPFIFELVNQPSWIQNIGDRGVRDLGGAEGYIQNGPLASYAKHGFGLWCVERSEDGVPVGICGLLQREYLDAPDIGYAFLERFQGQGFASETTAATVAYARETLGITRLLASVVPTNAGSIKVLEKVGMRFLRSEMLPGDRSPVSLYGIAG